MKMAFSVAFYSWKENILLQKVRTESGLVSIHDRLSIKTSVGVLKRGMKLSKK